jgi:hypothetical protein
LYPEIQNGNRSIPNKRSRYRLTWLEKKTDVPAKAMNTAVNVSRYSRAAWPEAENLHCLISGMKKGYNPANYVFNKKV